LAKIQELAEQHLAGTTPLKTTEAEMRRGRQDKDFHNAALSEADLDYLAVKALGMSQLPQDRLPMVRKDAGGNEIDRKRTAKLVPTYRTMAAFASYAASKYSVRHPDKMDWQMSKARVRIPSRLDRYEPSNSFVQEVVL